MPGAIELELDEVIKSIPDEVDIPLKGGGEGDGKTGKVVAEPEDKSGRAISAEDLANLQKELQAAKDDAARERQGRSSAETRTAEVERTSAQKLQSEIEKRIEEQSNTVETALLSAQGEIDSFKALAAKAMEEGKWADAAEAQENLADAKMRMRDLSYQKQELTRARETAKKTPAPSAPANKTQAWIAAHPRFSTDTSYNAAAMEAHYAAVKAGIQPESDEYFKRIEEATGDRKVEQKAEPAKVPDKDGEGGKDAAQADGETRVSGPAPVTRRTPQGNGGGGPKKITLTGDQVEAADSLFGDETNPLMYIKDKAERSTYWYKQQERLKAEGRI